METRSQMDEIFQNLYGTTDQQIIKFLGKPDMRLHYLHVYKRNNLWLVLIYSDMQNNEICVSGAAFFNKQLELLWSKNVSLVSSQYYRGQNELTVSEMVKELGLPHGHGGSGISLLVYLMDNGKLLLAYYNDDDIEKVEIVPLTKIEGQQNTGLLPG